MALPLLLVVDQNKVPIWPTKGEMSSFHSMETLPFPHDNLRERAVWDRTLAEQK